MRGTRAGAHRRRLQAVDGLGTFLVVTPPEAVEPLTVIDRLEIPLCADVASLP